MELLAAPGQLTVLTTDRCTAKCAHCCMNSSPTRRGSINADEAIAAIDALMAIRPLATVIFAGGEPTLLKDRLLQMISHCAGLGINTRIVTNASWAITPAKATAMITRLRGAGLHELNISADDYHLPFIQFGNVINAWRAAKGVGFRSVVIAACSHKDSAITPEYIEEQLGESLPRRYDDDGLGSSIPPPAEDGTIYLMSNSEVQMIGRGNAELNDSHKTYPRHPERLNGRCPFAVESAALTPKNELVACCGFELDSNPILNFGRATDADSVELALKTANDDLLVAAIMLYGPKYLMDFARSKKPDLQFREWFASVCEICDSVVNRPDVIEVLRAHSGEIANDVFSHPSLCPAELQGQ